MNYHEKISKILELMHKIAKNEGNEEELEIQLAKFKSEKDKAQYCAELAIKVIRLSNSNRKELKGEISKLNSMITASKINLELVWSSSGYKQKEFGLFLKNILRENDRLFREIYNLSKDTGLITTGRVQKNGNLKKITTWFKN